MPSETSPGLGQANKGLSRCITEPSSVKLRPTVHSGLQRELSSRSGPAQADKGPSKQYGTLSGRQMPSSAKRDHLTPKEGHIRVEQGTLNQHRDVLCRKGLFRPEEGPLRPANGPLMRTKGLPGQHNALSGRQMILSG